MRPLAIGAAVLMALGLVVALLARRPDRSEEATANRSAGGSFDAMLPSLGAVRTPLPRGEGQPVAERACLVCHSADLLRQQRLTEKQWTAAITKMIGWGAALSDTERAVLLPYLVSEFGPENDRFTPVVTRPVGR